MLILTSDACRHPRDVEAAAWPGPVVFAALVGHGLRRSALRAMEDDAVVVECLSALPSPGALLREVAARLPHLVGEADAPLFLASGPVGAATLREAARRGLRRVRVVEATWTPGGALETLLLGAEVAGHPLAVEVLAAAGAHEAADDLMVDLLGAALGAEGGAKVEGSADG